MCAEWKAIMRFLSLTFYVYQKASAFPALTDDGKILLISKITNFLFHSCGERHFLWFSCCFAVPSRTHDFCLLVVSFNIIIFISSANYSVFPLWGTHQRQTKACFFFCSISGDNIKRRHQKTLNIDTNSYDDSPTKSCDVGGDQREYWFFACLFTVVLVVRTQSEGKSLFRIHKCLSLSLNKQEWTNKKKLFSHNL